MKWLTFLTLAFAPAAEARRVEGRFSMGVTSLADEGAVNHLTAGGGLRFHLSRRWSVEPEFLYMRHNNFVCDRDYLLWGNFSFDFRNRERMVVPYWFAAPGSFIIAARLGNSRLPRAKRHSARAPAPASFCRIVCSWRRRCPSVSPMASLRRSRAASALCCGSERIAEGVARNTGQLGLRESELARGQLVLRT